MSEIYFISGIDTDAGKTYATGWLARRFIAEGKSVITQKFIQTGNDTESEDIVKHREIMGTGMFPEDVASAQLAAKLDNRTIDLNVIDRATLKLATRYDVVLVEGAGGLMVPITDDFFTIDYVATRQHPMILVTNGVLGSINHTILSLEAIKARGIKLHAVIYNTHFDTDKIIAEDTQDFIRRYLKREFPDTEYLIM